MVHLTHLTNANIVTTGCCRCSIAAHSWHWLTKPGQLQLGANAAFHYGVDHMPKVVVRPVEIGNVIRNHSAIQ